MNLSAETCFSINARCWTGGGEAGAADEKGYTIIEVMIAIAIFSIGILSAWALQHSSIRGNTSARNLTVAAASASDRLEQLIQLSYAHTDLEARLHNMAQDSDGIDNNFNGEIDEAGESGPLSISWLVTDNVPIQQSKRIRVNVTIGQRTISMTSYKANL